MVAIYWAIPFRCSNSNLCRGIPIGWTEKGWGRWGRGRLTGDWFFGEGVLMVVDGEPPVIGDGNKVTNEMQKRVKSSKV
jgi:hypothetical protein